MHIGILGGGLSGVSLQYFLKHHSEILEKENRIGGLCRTFVKNGFYYDIGGHILFSENNNIINFIKKVLGRNINYCQRKNEILFKNKYVKYPFENGIGQLDKKDAYECLLSFLRNDHPKPVNFKEWIYYTFGNGIAERYLIPYNEKIWKNPLEEIGLDWVERVPKPPLEDIVKSAVGIETEGYLHQLHFYYPKEGGIEALIKALQKKDSSVTTGFEVKKIQRRGQDWIVSDGNSEKQFDKLVLTIPVKEAVKYISKIPKKVLDAVNALRHNSVRIILMGVNNESLLNRTALYIPDRNIVAHRICYTGYFSKNMVPKGYSSLIAEVTTHAGHPLYNISPSHLTQRVIHELDKRSIINKRDIICTDVKDIEYAYVIHDLNHKRNTDIIKKFFASIGVELLGRFAEFEYINMDEVINRSRKMADRLNTLR
jgi:protoporphyrinogen oxidase